jgi:hypothetical protein
MKLVSNPKEHPNAAPQTLKGIKTMFIESDPNRHPNHLKVRLFGATPDSRYVQDANESLPPGLDLLQDLSALYQA